MNAGLSPRRGEHLRLALQAMSDVLVDQRARVVDALAVPGQDGQRLQRLHPAQRLHVVGHVALAGMDDRRGAVEDVIAGVERARRGVEEAEMVARVSGRVHGDQLDVAAAHDVAVGERLRVLVSRRRVEAVHRRSGLPGEPQRERAVVGVRVGEHDRARCGRRGRPRRRGSPRGGGRRRDRGRCRPAMAPPSEVRVRPASGEHRRVGCEHARRWRRSRRSSPCSCWSAIQPAMISGVISVTSIGCAPSVPRIASTDPSRANSWHIIRVGGMIAGNSRLEHRLGPVPATLDRLCGVHAHLAGRRGAANREEARVVAATLARRRDEVPDVDETLGRDHQVVFGERVAEAAPGEQLATGRPAIRSSRSPFAARGGAADEDADLLEHLADAGDRVRSVTGRRPRRRRRRRERRMLPRRSCSGPAGGACRPRRHRRHREAARRCWPGSRRMRRSRSSTHGMGAATEHDAVVDRDTMRSDVIPPRRRARARRHRRRDHDWRAFVRRTCASTPSPTARR